MSNGRFIVIDRGSEVSNSEMFNDEKKRVTIVGEIMGTTTIPIDDVHQQVPRLAVKHITVWDWDRVKRGYGPYAEYGYPYAWGYRGYYGYALSW